jgi:hypothetical protein
LALRRLSALRLKSCPQGQLDHHSTPIPPQAPTIPGRKGQRSEHIEAGDVELRWSVAARRPKSSHRTLVFPAEAWVAQVDGMAVRGPPRRLSRSLGGEAWDHADDE